MADTLPSCCGFRYMQVKHARRDLQTFVRRLSKYKTLRPAEQQELASLRGHVRSAKQHFDEHLEDETLEHK